MFQEESPLRVRNELAMVINKVAEDPLTRTHVITDGVSECAYGQVPEVLRKLDWLHGLGRFRKSSCYIFECFNTLPSALVMLWLLSRGKTFLLMPGRTEKAEWLEGGISLPEWCKWWIRAIPGEGGVTNVRQLRRHVTLVRNPGYVETRDPAPLSPVVFFKSDGNSVPGKLVQFPQANLLENARNNAARLKLCDSDRILAPVPVSGWYGLGTALLGAVSRGASLCLVPNGNVFECIERERTFVPNVCILAPSMCDVLRRGRREAWKYRLLVASGTRVPRYAFIDYDRRIGHMVYQYGCTELGAVAISKLDDSLRLRADGFMRAIEGVDVEFAREDPRTVPEAVSRFGALVVRHKYGFEGYADESGKLIKSVRSGGFSHFVCEDMGALSMDGYLKVLSRTDGMVFKNGFQVSLFDVERSLKQMEGVDGAVAVKSGGKPGMDEIAAFCTVAKGSNLTAEMILSKCPEFMGAYQIPDRVHVVGDFPKLQRDVVGVDRGALLRMVYKKAV